jgi:putative phosphoesterase
MAGTTASQRIAIVSDTHLPRGSRRIPEACRERLRAADLIVHAGDLSSVAVLRELQELGPVAAVRGNVDDVNVQALLPERLELTVAGARLGVIHDAGPGPGRLARLRAAFPEASAVIFGHSHIPLWERENVNGFQIFNPGSPTDKRRQPHYTMGWAYAQDGEISFEIVELISQTLGASCTSVSCSRFG